MKRLRHCLAAGLIMLVAPAIAAPPERVVSMNLCTDQLALLLAAPGQLVSVSDWAVRPPASNLVEEASAVGVNGGSAEEIFLLEPDLVLAGTFSDPVTVAMLRRLGLRVETVAPATSMAGVSETIGRIGALLGREAAAAALVGTFEAALARQTARADNLMREGAAYYYPNNYTSGSDTLADEVMGRAGLDNAAAALGIGGVARLPLETLVMAQPFLIRTETVSGARRGRSYETASHPALAALGAGGRATTVAERWQTCGTPFVVKAVAALIDARLGAMDEAR